LFVKPFSTECEHNINKFIVDMHRCQLKSNCPHNYFAVLISEERAHNSVFFIVERDSNIFAVNWYYSENYDSHVHVLTGFPLSLLRRHGHQTFIAERCYALEPQVFANRSRRFGHA
jgi:recombinational DNA repair protein RecR